MPHILPQQISNIGGGGITNLHQSLQLVKLAVKILKVVSVQSSEAIVIHDLHQHTEGLLLRHLKAYRQFHKSWWTDACVIHGRKAHLQALYRLR